MPSSTDPRSVVDALGEAISATRSLLVPVDSARWLRLAVIAVFVGGTVPSAGGQVSVPADPTWNWVEFPVPLPSGIPTGGTPGFGPPPSSVFLVVAAAVGLVVAFALAVGFVGATMEFVLVDGLVDRTVRVRDPFRRHVGDGLRLLGFRVTLLLGLLALVGGPILAVVGGGVSLGVGGAAVLVLAVPFALFAGIGAVLAFVVSRLTTDFVVPTMVATDCGVLDGWRRVVAASRPSLAAVAVYVLARLILGTLAASVVGIVGVLALALVAIPFVVGFGLLAGGLFAVGSQGAVTTVVAIGVVVFTPVAALTLGVVQAPIVSFFRYYALFVLGRLDADLDLVAELRETTDHDRGAKPSPRSSADHGPGGDTDPAERIDDPTQSDDPGGGTVDDDSDDP
jgi:hypothetical protein